MDTKSLHSAEYQALVRWLRSKREASNLTLRALAEEAGTFHSLIVKVEQCERNLSVVEFVQYCNALGVDPHEGIDIIQSKLKGKR